MLKVEHIDKSYGKAQVLFDVTFSLRSGEVAGFLGPNGAGKSTLMKMITGSLPIGSGTIEVCGQRVTTDNNYTKGKIGYLPELNPLYPDMYVREYLSFVAGCYGVEGAARREAVDDVVERTGLMPEANKRLRQLSKGYRQRVGLAAALVHSPEVLILDEPMTGLDPNQLMEIRQLIAELGREKTVLFSTHVMQEVEAMCERIIVLNHGHIVKDAAVADVMAEFGSVESAFVALTRS